MGPLISIGRDSQNASLPNQNDGWSAMKPELIRFSSHPRPFRVETVHCTNLECECTEVTFHFRELVEDGKSTAEAMVFQVRLDSQTWEEIVPPHRLPEVAQLVQEFLRDYPRGEREAIQELCQEKSRIARRLQEHRIDPQWVEDGTLVAFGEIIYDRAGGKADGSSFLYSFEHEGEKYLVDDLYCPNPECHCHEVHLAFVRCVPSSRPGNEVVAEDRFLAQLSFDGRAEVVECQRGTMGEAKTVLSAWQEHYGDDLRELRWRYEKVKQIARRSVLGRIGVSDRYDLLPEELAPATVRTGRNEPCPCGSGKKFKKCCGQKKDTTPRPR